MKPSIVLIYSIPALLFVFPTFSSAQRTTIKMGIYDFVENTASEFYVLSPIITAEYRVWKSSQLDLRISPGFSLNRTRYNSHYHYLYMIPLLTTVYYHLPNPDSKVWPSIGMGGSLLWKADYNKDFDKTHYSLSYGFHTTGRLNLSLKKSRLLVLDMTYNLLIPPVSEDVNLSGIILSVGLNFPGNQISK